MATFVGNASDDIANASTGVLKGFTGGTLAQLQDGLGDTIRALDGNDTVSGWTGNDLIEGGGNGDRLFGRGGHDRIFAMTAANPTRSASGDYIDGGAGNDRMFGAQGADTIYGSTGNDVLVGNAGNDVMAGGNGTDRLNGGAGADRMNGGPGNDIFVYSVVSDSGAGLGTRDSISGFTVHDSAIHDRINLTLIDAVPGGANNAFEFVFGSFTGVGQVRAIQSGNDALVQVNTGGTTAPEMTILLVGVNASAVSDLDFIL